VTVGKRSALELGAVAVCLAFVYVIVIGPLDRDYLIDQLVTAGCVALAVVGLTLVIGGSHQFHLGQGFFFGVGAYWTAVAAQRWSWPPLLALGSSAVVCCVLAWVIGRALNRVSGLYFAIATLALAVIGTSVAYQLREFTGGDNGLLVEEFSIAGWVMEPGLRSYIVVWTVALVGAWLASSYLRSRRGRAVRAVGGDEPAARALGISAGAARTQAFVIAAGFAAVGGGLHGFSSGFLYPDSFGLVASVEMVVYVIVGGATVLGGLIATGMLALIPLVFEQLEGRLDLVFGGVLVCLLVLLPEVPTPPWDRLKRRQRRLRAVDTGDVGLQDGVGVAQ
jgi:branched-chain amino acid transport system permease protein